MDYPVERRDFVVSISDSGALEPADSYNIVGLVGGDILSADFEEGDYVNKDDLLYQIDSSDAQKSIEQAQIGLENANLSYQNTLDNVETTPKAAVSGRVTRLYVKKGDEVQMGAPIAEISDNDSMVLRINFHKADIASISNGASAEVTINNTGEKLYGTVTSVSTAASAGSGGALVCPVEITVANPGGISAGLAATAAVNGVTCAESGAFQANASSTVTAKVSGTVSALLVSEGDSVVKDQGLVNISSDAAQRQIEGAQLNLRSAQLSLENSRDILDNYSIKAPISGTVVEKKYKAGDRLDNNSASVLAVIYDMSYLTLTLDIDELDIGSIEVGQKVTLEADALPGKTFEGYVDRVGVNGTSISGVTTYPVRVIVENYDALMPGMNVTAEVIIEEAGDVLSVPISAVNRGNTVLVVDPESQGDTEKGVPAGYRQVEVTTGRSTDEYIEITSGLNEGEQVGVSTATTSLMEQMMGMSTGAAPADGGPGERGGDREGGDRPRD